MINIVVTGGIGSGKSTVTQLLAECGAFVLDADQVSRRILEPGSVGLDRVVAHFGRQILAIDGSLDRAALAAIVFGNEKELAVLEGITHPLIAAETKRLASRRPAGSVVVHDVPLFTPESTTEKYDLVVVVTADTDVRIARLEEFRGMPEAQAKLRIAAQITDKQRLTFADVVIQNNGTLQQLKEQVTDLWQKVQSRSTC